MLGNRVAVSPIVTVEPRRRKFHKPITLTIPLPKASQKGMINQYGGDTPTLRLLCSITGKRKLSLSRAYNLFYTNFLSYLPNECLYSPTCVKHTITMTVRSESMFEDVLGWSTAWLGWLSKNECWLIERGVWFSLKSLRALWKFSTDLMTDPHDVCASSCRSLDGLHVI